MNHFDEPVAARYDDDLGSMGAPETADPVVDVLAELAGPGGSALEFAIGTGRIALPLAARGVSVTGIELSEAMVRRLRAKPRGDVIDVTATRTTLRIEREDAALVTSRLLADHDVRDLTVEDPPIDDVIELAFASGQPS